MRNSTRHFNHVQRSPLPAEWIRDSEPNYFELVLPVPSYMYTNRASKQNCAARISPFAKELCFGKVRQANWEHASTANYPAPTINHLRTSLFSLSCNTNQTRIDIRSFRRRFQQNSAIRVRLRSVQDRRGYEVPISRKFALGTSGPFFHLHLDSLRSVSW